MLLFDRKNFSIKNHFDSHSLVKNFKNILKERLSVNFQIKDISSLEIQKENSLLFLNEVKNY